MKSFGLTDRGKVRAENQDSFEIEYIESRDCLAVVLCDGMGGASAGSIASTLASKTYMNYLVDRIMASRAKNPDIKRHMTNACNKASDIVYSYSRFDKDYTGMGTTLVAATLMGNTAVIANVGDSRAYVISRKKITQITRDHSYVQELIEKGIITPEKAKTHPKRNVILQALGSEEGVKCDIFTYKLARGERLLLCSDGLTNMLSDEEILEAARSNKTPENLCKKLIELALEAGANDNVTVVTLSR